MRSLSRCRATAAVLFRRISAVSAGPKCEVLLSLSRLDLSDNGEQRGAVGTLAPPSESIDAETTPWRIYHVEQLDNDQEHIRRGPFALRVVKPQPKIDRHQRAERSAHPC